MNKIIKGVVACVIASQVLAIASEEFNPETEMARLLGRFAKKTSVITTPPRNKIVYNPDQLLSPGFLEAIRGQERIMKDLASKTQKATELASSIDMLTKELKSTKSSLEEAESARTELTEKTSQLEVLLGRISSQYQTLAESSEKLEKVTILNSKIVSVITETTETLKSEIDTSKANVLTKRAILYKLATTLIASVANPEDRISVGINELYDSISVETGASDEIVNWSSFELTDVQKGLITEFFKNKFMEFLTSMNAEISSVEDQPLSDDDLVGLDPLK